MPITGWEKMVDRSFDEGSTTIIQNDLPVNARYLLKKMLDQAVLRGWREFFLISTRLCYDESTDQAGDRVVYDYPPLIDACRTFITNGGTIRVLTWRAPEVNNFTRALVRLHRQDRFKDSVTIASMNEHQDKAHDRYWLDCAISGTSYRVEVPDRDPQSEKVSQNSAVGVKAIACANDDLGYVELLRKRFEYFSKRAQNALPSLMKRAA